jgi:hypothetical protein
MRNRALGSCSFASILALWALLALAPVLRAQNAGQPGATNAQPKSAQTFDPHDLSGIWGATGGGGGGADQARGAGAPPRPCNFTMNPYPPDPKCTIESDNAPGGDPTVHIEGPNVLAEGVHMTAWAHDLWMSQDRGLGVSGTADPYDHCDPLGMPRVLVGYIHPFKVLQLPGETWMIYEEEHMWRLIYTDGRPLPKVEDLPFGPNWMGYSVGHWDGNDFIVETIGQNDKTWLDMHGHVHSDDMLLKDTYRRTNHDTLEVSFSFHDPKAYDKDWSYGPRKYVLKTGKQWEIQESFCTIEDEQTFNKNITDPAGAGVGVAPRAKP